MSLTYRQRRLLAAAFLVSLLFGCGPSPNAPAAVAARKTLKANQQAEARQEAAMGRGQVGSPGSNR